MKQKLGKGNKLVVDDLFYSIQTEGPLAGRPAYFIRLFGCNLSCSWCDQPQETGTKMKVKDIVDRVKRDHASYLVVITGGEPLLQNVTPLVMALLEENFTVQFETNGTVSVPGLPWGDPNLFIVCSPKTKKIHKDIAKHANCFKYVVSLGDSSETDGLPKGVYRTLDSQLIVVSPRMDEHNLETTENNTMHAVNLCKQYGYYLSLQTHKFINIP